MLKSLKAQSILVAFATTLVALAVMGFLLVGLFEREISKRVHTEIHNHLLQLVGTLEVAPDGTITKKRLLADSRFLTPFSGYYWQINQNGVPLLRSRSLWDEELKVPANLLADTEEPVTVDSGTVLDQLIIHTRTIFLPGAEKPILAILAVRADEVAVPVRGFRQNLTISLVVVGLCLTLMAALPLWLNLRPINRLAGEVSQIKAGRRQVSVDYASEIQPIATELNRLLGYQEKVIAQARGRAADFAHGLKTPLAIIEAMLTKVPARQAAWARELRSQTQNIHRLVERELARARAAAGYGEPARDLREIVAMIGKTIAKLPRAGSLSVRLEVPLGMGVRMAREDLIEVIANLFDNARKWAKSEIAISVVRFSGQDWLEVRDDGPGVSPDLIAALGSRGLRLDERIHGSGIGLSIAKDILDSYGLSISFENVEPSGLCVRFQLPVLES